MSLDNIDFTKYIHPLLIDGERFFLNVDPFQYAENAVLKYWSDRVDELALELSWEEGQIKGLISSEEQLRFVAARILAPHFMCCDDFFKYYKQDGGDMIRDKEQLKMMEYEELDDERSLA